MEQEILQFIIESGQLMLISGAEVSRTQTTMQIMAHSLQMPDMNIYVVANGVFASTKNGQSEVRHVSNTCVHLGKTVAINALSRDLAQGKENLSGAQKRLESIKVMPEYPTMLTLVATGLGAGGFCYMFDSTLQDAYCAFFIGCLLGALQLVFVKFPTNKLLYNLSCAIFIAVLGIGLVQFQIGDSVNHIIIGSIFPLVPGLLITNSIRDFIGSDYISGMIHLLDALLIAGSIALGIGFVLKICSFIPGVIL